MVKRFFVVILMAMALVSCATAPQATSVGRPVKVGQVPDALGDQGLLVAVIAGKAVSKNVIEQLSFSMASVQIDNVYYENAVHENYLVLPLKPGDYTLDSLLVFAQLGGGNLVRFPLDYKFHINRGQATNLGVIALLPIKGKPNGYLKIRVDNTRDMQAYLRGHYPKLAAHLHPQAPVLSPDVKYARAALLEAVRRDVARQAWYASEEPGVVNYIGGEVGTIARLLRDSRGKVAAIDVLNTGTTSAMLSCGGYGQRFVCSSAEPALYFVTGDKVERRPFPIAVTHAWVHPFPPHGLVLVDPYMNVYTSTDGGASWSKHVWASRTSPLDPLATVKFTDGRNGYYIYGTFPIDPLAPQAIYSGFARIAYQRVEIPNARGWQRLLETSRGLLLGPQPGATQGDAAALYFRPAGQTRWEARPLPSARCFMLQRERANSDRLLVFCGDKFYASTDAGRTWAPNRAGK